MGLTRLSVITATLDWHYVASEDSLSFGWDVTSPDTEERIFMGAAPGRHLADLDDQAVASVVRLCELTRRAVAAVPQR